MRRKWTEVCKCGHHGCGEVYVFEYPSYKIFCRNVPRKTPWICSKHRDLEALICEASKSKTIEMEVYAEPYGKFWSQIKNGFASGPGFRAFAEDFPVGTKLIVTATAIYPEARLEAKETINRMTQQADE